MEVTAMELCYSPVSEAARSRSLDLLNRHLAAAVVLQDRMRQSPRNVRGRDFIMVDDLCDRVARLMEGCTVVIVARVAGLGGVPKWPDQPDCYSRTIAAETQLAIAGPLDAFGQSVLDAATVAEAYGDTTTADLLAGLWHDVDRHLWMTVKSTDTRVHAP